MPTLFPSFQPRPEDVIVLIMGMTGSGKSTFISLCTGEDVPVGHSLEACKFLPRSGGTQQIGIYKCQWSSDVDIYLIDTPGFDDTNRSDTDVLKETATWLTDSYERNLKLSGIIYLHRITDPRMGGSAKKNLFMFKKLCGADALRSVVLVTTMWELAEASVGQGRETDLVNTRDFWGVLIESGATLGRHDNTRETAMRLLKRFIRKNRMTMQVQKEMVNDRKTLDQTQAGMELDSELQKERERFSKDLADAQEMMKQAIDARDQESTEMLRQHKKEMQRKIDRVVKQREELKVSMEKMHAEKLAEFERRYEEQQEKLRKREESIDKKLEQQHNLQRDQERETKKEIKRLEQQLMKAEAQVKATQNIQSPSHTESTAHTNHNDFVCVTLFGYYYYFLGPWHRFYHRPSGLRDAQKRGSIRYVSIGTAGSWYAHCHKNGRCYTEVSETMAAYYPKFMIWLDKNKEHCCPAHVTLGNEGMYYIRTKNRKWSYSLPRAAIDRAGDFKKVRRVWLGADDAYIIETKDSWIWDLAGNYGSLGDTLEEYDESDGVKEIAMNIEDPRCYVIISETSEYAWNAGSKGNTFSDADLKKYITMNFRGTSEDED